MSYVPLGSRTQTGVTRDGAEYMITFSPADMHIATAIQYFECYKFVVNGATGSSFQVLVDNNMWDINTFGEANALDMVQPMLLQAGQSVIFRYTYPAPGEAPSATIWLRYDPDLLASQARRI